MPNCCRVPAIYARTNFQQIITLISADNYDKVLRSAHAGILCTDKELHFMHIFAKILEILPHLTTPKEPLIPIANLKAEDLLPNKTHFAALKIILVIICLRVITMRVDQFKHLAKKVVKHIPHKYSEDLKYASVVVSSVSFSDSSLTFVAATALFK